MNKCLKKHVVWSNAKPMQFKRQCADYVPSSDDTVRRNTWQNIEKLHRRAHGNRVASYQLVVTHAGNEIFSYVPARRPWYPNRIDMTRSSVGLRGRSDRYRSVSLTHEYRSAKITNTKCNLRNIEHNKNLRYHSKSKQLYIKV